MLSGALKQFLCNQSGMYFVSLTVQKNDNVHLEVNIQIGSESVFELRDYYDGSRNNILSNSAVVFCKEGDFLSVVAINSGSVFGEPESPRSMLTVFRLNQQGRNT